MKMNALNGCSGCLLSLEEARLVKKRVCSMVKRADIGESSAAKGRGKHTAVGGCTRTDKRNTALDAAL